MSKQRRHYAPDEKVAILGRHLVEGVPISERYACAPIERDRLLVAPHRKYRN